MEGLKKSFDSKRAGNHNKLSFRTKKGRLEAVTGLPVRFPAENFMTELVVSFIVSLVIVVPAYIWIVIYGRKDIHENEAILNEDIVTNNEDEFRLAVDGSVSKDVLASGELEALEPVSYPEVAGEYLSVVKVIEHYNQYQTGVLLWRETHYRWEEYGREERALDCGNTSIGYNSSPVLWD